ncbi:MAG: ATP-binding cassette domain-containing protein [Actinomycetota bacterium]|nr:ATP-binding cassette domain-containing protein [Actinomycetota bacterium]
MIRLLSVCIAVDRRLAAWIVTLGVLQGLLLPGFMLATGSLVGALSSGRSPTVPLVVVGVVFTGRRLLDPVSTELSAMLMRRVDESLSERVMRAMATPPGLSHVEDPVVLDAAVQAEGALTGATPGGAAAYLGFFIKGRVAAAAALLIVATYRPLLVPLLVSAYVLAYRFTRWHWYQVAQVMHGGTEALRRSFYLRTLALTPTVSKEIRVFGLAGWLVGRYRSSWLAVMHDVWQTRREGWTRIAGVALLLAAVEAVALGLMAGDAAGGRLGVGEAVAVAQAILAAAVLAEFTQYHWLLSESLAALDKLEGLETLAAAATTQLRGSRRADAMPSVSIRFEDVSFTYPGRPAPVFAGFDLEIKAGRSLAIVGENGAGKTTLVKLMARLYDPDAGRVLVDGVDLRELDPESWRSRLAPVFQDHLQLEISAYDNIAFGALNRQQDTAGVQRAAQLAGAAALIEQLPAGWDTTLSRAFTGGSQLSGGEWQRIALSRALFAAQAGAAVLILDEPTAAMDVRGEAEVYERFLELTRGVTTVVISHRFSTVRRADRIVVIEHGRVAEDGSHTELVRAGGRYATMYQLQAVRFAPPEDAGA